MRDKRISSAVSVEALAAQAVMAGLVYVSDNEPGIRRIRQGSAFQYIGPDEKVLTDQAELERIARLAIPPAYNDVWICHNAQGHLQATGFDARMRKQYRYHTDWRIVRDRIKFCRMADFGEALPSLRQRLQHDLRRHGLPQEKILAAIVSLLDRTRVRIGNRTYARDNRSFGLTTLRKRHLASLSNRRAVLKFKGKSGIGHEVMIDDKRIVKIIHDCQQLRGHPLFQYVDSDGKRHAVKSEQVNSYLHETMGADFTAKDFRTWGATLRAFELMLETPLPEVSSKRRLQACIVSAIKKVAEELRNTVAVCRKSYINPWYLLHGKRGFSISTCRNRPNACRRNWKAGF
ncbi:DNA topoisomerase IB [Nitrosovibrio tenuis]|uniref:DNA topoisomerase n=2 Tax=Nitrosovibrio tenuis TaxID=1233 RepID=A0A1H7QZ13_9PROT|nr:DNA topoisomerase IB [Nitrosovibrio tenuis]